MTIATLGIDIDKTLNSVVGMDAKGRVVLLFAAQGQTC